MASDFPTYRATVHTVPYSVGGSRMGVCKSCNV